MNTKRAIFSGFISGLMLVLGWPGVEWTYLLFIAFIPLLLFVYDKKNNFKSCFIAALSSFFTWFAGSMYWLLAVSDSTHDIAIILLSFLIIPLMMSIPVLLFKGFITRFHTCLSFFVFPLLWTGFEFVQLQWTYGFTWLRFGLGFASIPWLSAICFYLSPAVLGFIVLLFNTSFAWIIYSIRTREANRTLITIWPAIFALTFIVFAVIKVPNKKSRSVRIAVIQPDIDPKQSLDEHSLYKQVMLFKRFALSLKKDAVDLLVCPEGYLRSRPEAPIILNDLKNNKAILEMQHISSKLNAPIITGMIALRLFTGNEKLPAYSFTLDDGRKAALFNTALMITPDGGLQIAVKNKLVPFMERIPEGIFHLSLNQMQKGYSSIDSTVVFQYKNLKIAPLICMDITDETYIAKMMNPKANLMVHISNDGWSGRDISAKQNECYARTMAISFNLPVVRSCTNGYSGFISNSGDIISKLNWHQAGILTETIELTPFSPKK